MDGNRGGLVEYDAVGNELRLVAETGDDGRDGDPSQGSPERETYEYSPRNHLARQNATAYNYDGRGIRTITLRPVRLVAFTITPSDLSPGDAEGSVTLSSPAPAGGTVVYLSSSSPVVTVPSSVTVPGGLAAVSFVVGRSLVEEEMHVVVTASYNDSELSVTMQYTGSDLDDVQMGSSAVVGGESTTASVRLRRPAPEGGVVVSLESSTARVVVPAEVVIPGGAWSAALSVGTLPVEERLRATVTARLGADQRAAELLVLPAAAASLTFSPSALHGGGTTTGTLVLSDAAPEGGTLVALERSSDLLTVPESVVVETGSTSTTFVATAHPVEDEIVVNVTALDGETAITGSVTIQPPLLDDLVIAKATVIGGRTVTSGISLNAPAAEEGARIELTSSAPEIVIVPESVVVPSGASSVTETFETAAVSEATPVVIAATRHGITRSTTVTIEPSPVAVASLRIEPSSLVGTNEAVGTVTLTDLAPPEGLEIELTSSDFGIAKVSPAISVVPGMDQASFVIETSLVAEPATAVITAAYAGTEVSAALQILPPEGNHVSSLIIEPLFVTGGGSVSGTVTLAFPSSDKGGSDVVIASSDPSVISGAPKIKVRAGTSSATLTLATKPVAEPVAVMVSASYGGAVQRARVIVAPKDAVTIESIAIVPDRVFGGAATAATITLTGPAPFGGATVALTRRGRKIVSMPETVIVPEGSATASFTMAADAISGPKEQSVEIAARYNGITATARLTVTPLETAELSPEPLALCASLSLVPCLTASAFEMAPRPPRSTSASTTCTRPR